MKTRILTSLLLSATASALLLAPPALAQEKPSARRGGKLAWRHDVVRQLATARACADEQCLWKPVILYFTADW